MTLAKASERTNVAFDDSSCPQTLTVPTRLVVFLGPQIEIRNRRQPFVHLCLGLSIVEQLPLPV
jgi:hypothetical protein